MPTAATTGLKILGVLTLRLRALSAFALILLLAQYVLPGLHHAVEAHEVCPEHGELVHSAAVHAEAARAVDGQQLSPGAEPHEHGHCAIVPAVSRDGQALAPPAELTVVAEGAKASAVVLAARAHARKTQLFRLAPKQSPPA